MAQHARAAERRRWLGGAVLGVALGGFFDGILLHQVLQWHHLLSLVGGESLRDVRMQILADGLFHVLMYAVAAAGLWLLWAGRAAPSNRADHVLLASTFLGFGVWQVVDIVLFHWILGIHRIRVDVPNPLAWDIGWMVVFGLPALVIAGWLFARAKSDPPPDSRSRMTPSAVTTLVLMAGSLGLLQPANSATVVLFRSDVSPDEAFSAVAAADGRVVWAHASAQLIAVAAGEHFNRLQLYRSGAIFVGVGGVAGCAAFPRSGT
jgi:uncharacterized membrane protein